MEDLTQSVQDLDSWCGYGSIPIDTFLVGWTSIYQLFWCSPGVQGFDTLPCEFPKIFMVFHGCPLAMKLPKVAPIVAQLYIQQRGDRPESCGNGCHDCPAGMSCWGWVYQPSVIEISGKIHIFHHFSIVTTRCCPQTVCLEMFRFSPWKLHEN